jgi:hypothetical protein
LKRHDLLRGDLAVTAGTLDLGRRMRPVAEEHKIRQLVDELHRDFSVGQIRVTDLALRQGRKAGPIGTLGILVTECALLLQGRVLLMVERANVGQ